MAQPTSTPSVDERDRWAEWLAERRFGGDPEVRHRFTEELTRRRDEILDRAGLAAGETLLDVGCGEGLLEAIQPPDSDPMLDFDERDLMTLAERAGFFPIRLRLDAEIVPSGPRDWDGFLNSSGNPRIPTLLEAMDEALTPGEQRHLVDHLRPLVEEGRGVWRMASAYLWATRPR